RRILLCVGIVDELPDLPGYRQLWGRSLYQCPYCHGWELRDRAWGYLANDVACLEWSLLLRAWTPDLVVFTSGRFAVRGEDRELLERCRIRLDERPVVGFRAEGESLAAVQLAGGAEVRREVMFVRPPQRQTGLVMGLVASFGLKLATPDRVHVDNHQTSVRGIYAAGDLASSAHGALIAAGSGNAAAHALGEDLTRELLLEGML
nr:NAD(P)/FAD-dependent oxidoreductase [Deltaproteobacteria bacterium]